MKSDVPHHSEPAREAVATCPSCGSAGKMIACMGSWKPGDHEPDGRRIACSSMECITAGKPFYGEGMEANAIAWWNRRASPAPAGGGLGAKTLRGIIARWETRREYLNTNPSAYDAFIAREVAGIAEPALASPAATSAETQGGDGVREAAELLSHLKLYVLEKLDPDDADALRDRMGDLTAALAPSTSAATSGEPVAWVQPGYLSMLQKCGSCSMRAEPIEAMDYIVPIYGAPPAPAVESAQVKEGRSDG